MIGYTDPGVGYNEAGFTYNGEAIPDIFLVVGGQRREDLLTNQSLTVTTQVEERTVARFHLADDASALDLEKGVPVHIRWQGTRLFDGVIDVPTENALNRGVLGWDITCVDWHYLTDRRKLSAGFTGGNAGDIARFVAAQLADDGVSEGTIEDGPAISEVAFLWVSATKILDRAAEQAGFTWFLDGLKRLHFHSRQTVAAPFALDSQDLYQHGSLKAKNRNPDHRTRQVIRGGKAETDPQTENFTADGVQQTFVVGFPIAREPTITEDTITQAVGVKGFGEAGARWLWARGSAELTLAEGETVPADGVAIEVTYQGLFDIVLVATDQAETERVKNLEGFGTGVIDHVVTDPSIATQAEASERASALLVRYARPAREITFVTDQPGLDAGQLLTVNLAQHRLDTEVLITQVRAKDASGRLEYTVAAVDGPVIGSWARFFARLAERTDPLAFRENISEEETVIILESTSEDTGWVETTTETVYACEPVETNNPTFPASTTSYVDATVGYADPATPYQGDVTGATLAC